MTTFPYNEIAALLIEDSTWVSRSDHPSAEHAVDAIIDALSLTRLREYLLLHLTIGSWPDDLEQLPTGLERPRSQQREQAAEPC